MARIGGSRGIGRCFGALLGFASAASYSGTARADGGIPRPYGILFEPGNPSRMVVHSHFWGLFDGMLGSSDYRLLCSQAFGGRDTDEDKYETVLAQGGRILVAAQGSGLNISDEPCTWRKIDAFNGENVEAVAPTDANGKNFILATVIGDTSGTTSRVYASGDRGDTWSQKSTLPHDVSIADMAVAPSDGMRVYGAGVVINGGPRQLAVSKDGGVTFAVAPIGAMSDYDAKAGKSLSIAGISPTDPDTVFVRADGNDNPAFGDSVPDELWVSRDGGQNWVKAYSPMMDLSGFAITPDGKNVLIAGMPDGILQASLADAAAAKPGAFTQIYAGNVWGLTVHDGKLYAGTDDFSAMHLYTVGVSTDGGKTFERVMGKCDVSPPACAVGTTMQKMCGDRWDRQGGYVTDILTPGKCTVAGSAGAAGAAGAGGVTGGGGSSSGGVLSTAGTGAGGANAGGGSPGGGAGGAAKVLDFGNDAPPKSSSCSAGGPRSSRFDPTMLMVAAATLGARVARSGRRRRL